MHLLLIFLLLVIAFPIFARFVGAIVRLVFWLVAASTILAIVEAIVG